MELKDTPEETDGYAGLYGEVVTEDIYRLRQLPFVPDVIFDLGANIGVFTRYARELFPNAYIVSVEPNPTNFAHLKKFTVEDDNMMLLEAAIGMGQMFHALTASNGSGECYLNAGLGYPADKMPLDDRLEKINIECYTVDFLWRDFVHEGQKVLIKLDIEGNEHSVFTHYPSMECLRKCNAFVAEIHFYAIDGSHTEEVNQQTMAALKSLEATHKIELDNVNFRAWRYNSENN